MRVVLALDKFKGTLTAQQACEFLAEGIRQRNRKLEVVLRPMSDGGEGTAAILAAALGMESLRIDVTDLLGRPCEANLYWDNARRIALIESAEVLGLHRTLAREELLLASSSLALGHLIQKALNLRPTELWVAVGGTMTADIGWGLASVFGMHATDTNGARVEPCLANMEQVSTITMTEPPQFAKRTRVVILCDVNAPARGGPVSLSSFLPQKGALPTSIPMLEKRIGSFWEKVATTRNGMPRMEDAFMGAGGGLCCGLAAVFPNLRMELGSSKVARTTALHSSLQGAQLAVCGEGCLDEQTLYGKAAAMVGQICARQGVRLFGIFGRINGDRKALCEKLGITTLQCLFDETIPSTTEIHRLSRHRLYEIGLEIGQMLEDEAYHTGD